MVQPPKIIVHMNVSKTRGVNTMSSILFEDTRVPNIA